MRNKAWEALQKDNEGAVPAEALGSLPKSELAGLEERLRRTGKEGRNEEEMPGPPECVRPGRLLTALAALELEIVSTLPDFEVRQVEKLREVRSVCMDVLEDIAMTGSSSSASGDPEYGPDPPAFSA